MAEILTLEYNAGTEGLVVSLDAVGTHGGPMAGAALPTERVTLSEMDPVLAVRWRALLADTHDYLRARVPAHGVVPDDVVAERAALAREREQIAQARLEHEAASEALDAQIAEKRAALAALEVPAETATPVAVEKAP